MNILHNINICNNITRLLAKLSLILFLSFFNQDIIAKNLNDEWKTEPESKFRHLNVAKSTSHMVSTANETASNAANEIIKKGGNAIDAAIAAQLVLNLVEPQSSGIGGGGFLLYYDNKSKQTTYFNGRETAPASAYPTMFLDINGKAKPFEDAVQGGLSVATPGLLKSLEEAHKKFGKLPWATLFEPAIKLADDGFIMNPRLHLLLEHIKYLDKFPKTIALYRKPNGESFAIGEIVTNKEFAKTLRNIAKKGSEPFYNGKIAKKIVEDVRNSNINPGLLNIEDLKNYQVRIGDLICSNYRKIYKICSMPMPSSGGVTLLQIMGIIENFDFAKKYSINSPQLIHLITEATRLSYADRNQYLGDVEAPISSMLDKKYLANRAKLIKKHNSLKYVYPGDFSNNINNDRNYQSNQKIINNLNGNEKPSTTHISIIDKEGNAISLTSSIEYYFGSALATQGFLLNNEMTDFSLIPEIDGKKVANAIAPNKQPRSSMTPTFVFDNQDNLLMVVGSPGGPRIIQFVLKTIIAYLDYGLNIQEAVNLPNFVVLNDVIELEKNTKIIDFKPQLEKMGHKVTITEITSGINAITTSEYNKANSKMSKKITKIEDKNEKIDIINDESINNNIESKYFGAADPRRDGTAIGN